jgi:acyl-CoA synthetase (AMP-forming)/AMP-acid ligase II
MFDYKTETIVAVAQKRAEAHPDRDYLIFLEDGDDKEVRVNYGQLDQSARQVAGWMQNKGLEKGDRALVILPNSVEFVKIFFGCLYGGILAVPLSEPAGPQQMQAYLETFVPTLKSSRPKMLITTPMLVAFLSEQLPPPLKEMFASVEIVSDQEILADQKIEPKLPALSPEDIAYLQYTSGSTGTPKGIMIGHSNLMANMEQAKQDGGWGEEKGTGLWLPLFHDFGLAAGLVGGLYMGGFVVLMTPVQFIIKPFRWLRAMSKYGCDFSYAPPFAYDICFKKISDEEKKQLDLSSASWMVYGAEPVHYTGVKNFNDTFAECGLKPDAVRPGFGMAETVIMFSVSKILTPLIADRTILEREGKLKMVDDSEPEGNKKYLVSLGPSMPDHEIVIKDEQNRLVPEGIVGEILISGPSVCRGYFENPEATKEIFQQQIEGQEQAFLSTGDLGLMWQGELYFTGRIKDVVIIRGRNYYPQDIEYALPEIKEIRPGCTLAFSAAAESGEQLVLAMEVKKELLKDMDTFNEYILPTIDRKVAELVGERFQIHPAKRLYLMPGTITKTSSGKIKHEANARNFRALDFEGLLAKLPEIPEVETEESDFTTAVRKLFLEIVEQEPLLDEPFLDLGGDSIKLLDFVETLKEKFPIQGDEDIVDLIDESITIQDMIKWFEERF